MRDGIEVLKAGKPVIVFTHDRFERAARAQATGLGAADLRLYVYPQFEVGNLVSSVEEQKAVKAVEEFPKLILETPK